MADKPRALILCPEAPYPLAGGGAMRTASLVEYLARHYVLDVVVFGEPGAPDPAATRLAQLAARLRVIRLPGHQKHPAARALRNLGRLWRGIPPLTDRFAGFEKELEHSLGGQRYQLGVVEHFWCAGYAKTLGACCGRVVLDLHNVESVLHERCARTEAWPLRSLHRQFQSACRRLEEEWFRAYSQVLTASEADARRVRVISPGAEAVVYPNTIPSRKAPETARQDAVVFSANMEYHPNRNAVRYFRSRVWPRLRERYPELVWRLVGKNPRAIRRIVAGDRRIEVTGPVADALPELARAKVAVAPLLAGSGTRVKILEAWAAATPVVSTSIGAEGLLAKDGRELLIADDDASFAAAVASLLESGERRREIGESGRRLYRKMYTWDYAWSRLKLLHL